MVPGRGAQVCGMMVFWFTCDGVRDGTLRKGRREGRKEGGIEQNGVIDGLGVGWMRKERC